MDLLKEYKNMTLSDKNEFLILLKKGLDKINNKKVNNTYTYSDLIQKLEKENIDIDLYFNIIKNYDEIMNIANSLKGILKNKKD